MVKLSHKHFTIHYCFRSIYQICSRSFFWAEKARS